MPRVAWFRRPGSPRPCRTGETKLRRIAVLDDYLGNVLSHGPWGRLQGRASIDVHRDSLADERRLAERLRPYHVVVAIRERSRFPRSLLEQLPALELLALTGHISGHADVDAATELGILVTETEGSGIAAVELTMGLILAAARGIPREDATMRQGGWQTGLGMQLAGKTLGIIGLGRIGARIAAFGTLLGMDVLACGRSLTDERAAAAGARRTSLDALLEASDIVSVHLGLTEDTRHFLTAAHLARMKPTAYLVNTARGAVLDEAALTEALRGGRIAGAALDVYEQEPLPSNHPLRSLENVVLSPHMGYMTREAYTLFFTQAVESIGQYLDGRVPARALNPDALARRPGSGSEPI